MRRTPLELVRIGAGASIGLGARSDERGSLAYDQALKLGTLDSRERRSVIELGSTLGGDEESARDNRDRAIHIRDVELVCDVLPPAH